MSTPERNTAAAIYVRISRDATETGLGVARQRKDCATLAEAKGWNVIETYEDNDVSASTGKPRPAYQRMSSAVEAGKIDALVVWDVDRLTRTPRELEDVIDWSEKHGLQLANVGGEIDLSTPQGKMMARIKGTVARHEVEQSSRRIRRKREEMAQEGRYVGPRPFGWDFTADKGLVINDAEAAVVRESVNRLLAGESIRSITYDLNNRGITTGRGSRWQAANFRQMVLRWTNAAVLTHKGKEVGPGDWPAIVSREDQERVIAVLTDPRRRTNNRGTAEKYLLSGILACAECGGRMMGSGQYTYQTSQRLADGTVKARMRTQGDRYRCQVHGCRKVTRHMDDLDAFVTEYTIGLLEREGVELFGGDDDAAETARARAESIEAKLSIAADQFADDLITADQFQRINARLRPQLEDARAELRRALPAEGLADFTGPSTRQAWEASTIEQRKIILRALTDAGMTITAHKVGVRGPFRAEFDPNTVEIAWQ